MITIITATYNSEATIERTIESLLRQTMTVFEFIIVDGKSTDNTINLIKKYEETFKEKQIPLTVISEKDTGIYDAWNKGVINAKGDWIGFIGSDDRYYENALKKYKIIIDANRDLDYISSKVKVVKNDITTRIISGKWQWRIFKKYMNVAHVGSLHSKKYFEKYGLYSTKYKIAGDYEMLLRAKDGLKYMFLDEFTAEMDDGGLSNNQIYKTLIETKQAKINTGKTNSFVATIHFLWALIKAKLKGKY